MVTSILWLLFTSSFAENASCLAPKSYKEFYQCSLLRHPDFEISKLKSTESVAIEEQASQWQNPELEVQEVKGKLNGANSKTSEAKLAIPLSQLWTRGARADIGEVEKKIVQVESSEALLNAQKFLILNLYRLRQIDTEIAILDESVNAFETIQKQFRNRPARGPEQEVSLSVVELASSDYELKKSRLSTEKSEILSKFQALWGSDFKITQQILPPTKEKWPEINTSANIAHSFQIRKIQLEAERAQAEKSLAIRESWPELKAGPAVEKTDDGVNSVTSYGFNVSMSLPIFSLNGGSRKLTESRSRQAQLRADYAIKSAQAEKEILIQKYKSAVEALKKSSNKEEMRKKHNKVDGLFRQGLVSGALVIEAHRQITEFTESQHQQELTAIETYLEYKTLSGENGEEIL